MHGYVRQVPYIDLGRLILQAEGGPTSNVVEGARRPKLKLDGDGLARSDQTHMTI